MNTSCKKDSLGEVSTKEGQREKGEEEKEDETEIEIVEKLCAFFTGTHFGG